MYVQFTFFRVDGWLQNGCTRLASTAPQPQVSKIWELQYRYLIYQKDMKNDYNDINLSIHPAFYFFTPKYCMQHPLITQFIKWSVVIIKDTSYTFHCSLDIWCNNEEQTSIFVCFLFFQHKPLTPTNTKPDHSRMLRCQSSCLLMLKIQWIIRSYIQHEPYYRTMLRFIHNVHRFKNYFHI